MELHSYAKRRTLKKWAIEQKRKLVEARIAHDAWFTNKPSSVVPWKNILIAANLDDFNVFFVRKQWSNMLARYKLYKQTRLGNNISSKAIDTELIKRISQEWEFFEPIHKFMTRKTTNLHSYALTHRTDSNSTEQEKQEFEEDLEVQQTSTFIEQDSLHHQIKKTPTKMLSETIITNLPNKPKDCVKENIPNNTTIVVQSNIAQDDDIHVFSSDTSNEFQVIGGSSRIKKDSKEQQMGSIQEDIEDDENMNCVRNTDHDFYSKRSSLGDMIGAGKSHMEDELQEQQSNYFADASEESQGSMNMVNGLPHIINTTNAGSQAKEKTVNGSNFPVTEIKLETTNPCETENLILKAEIPDDQEFLQEMPSTSTQSKFIRDISNPQISSKCQLSERDKYYRHKRRCNRRLEKRFDAFLLLVGQVVKTSYPNVDVKPLENTIASLASGIGKVLSSDSEDDHQSDNSNNNIPKSNYMDKN